MSHVLRKSVNSNVIQKVNDAVQRITDIFDDYFPNNLTPEAKRFCALSMLSALITINGKKVKKVYEFLNTMTIKNSKQKNLLIGGGPKSKKYLINAILIFAMAVLCYMFVDRMNELSKTVFSEKRIERKTPIQIEGIHNLVNFNHFSTDLSDPSTNDMSIYNFVIEETNIQLKNIGMKELPQRVTTGLERIVSDLNYKIRSLNRDNKDSIPLVIESIKTYLPEYLGDIIDFISTHSGEFVLVNVLTENTEAIKKEILGVVKSKLPKHIKKLVSLAKPIATSNVLDFLSGALYGRALDLVVGTGDIISEAKEELRKIIDESITQYDKTQKNSMYSHLRDLEHKVKSIHWILSYIGALFVVTVKYNGGYDRCMSNICRRTRKREQQWDREQIEDDREQIEDDRKPTLRHEPMLIEQLDGGYKRKRRTTTRKIKHNNKRSRSTSIRGNKR